MHERDENFPIQEEAEVATEKLDKIEKMEEEEEEGEGGRRRGGGKGRGR